MLMTFRSHPWLLLIGLTLSGACSSEMDPTTPLLPLVVGQSHGGGIIFYLDDADEHGLIAAASDLDGDPHWFNGSHLVTGATGTEIGTGQANTSAIVNVQGAGSYAAGLCDQLVLNGFSDWFLPSKDELNALFLQKARVEGFDEGFYWSSTEHGEGSAWEQVFNTGDQHFANKNFPIKVRPIRAF